VLTVYSPDHHLHCGGSELIDGRMVEALERPERAERIVEQLRAAKLGEVVAPKAFRLDAILRVHDEAFVAFLRDAHALWRAQGKAGFALPYAFPGRGSRSPLPASLDGKLGYYAFDASTPITAGTFRAATAAADVALTAQQHVAAGAGAAFALCRPPGHHAARASYGGYCFLNNAAIAAQVFTDAGARVAVLDLDYHHGNGTQAIFYARQDVLFVSLHADPADEFPFFWGYADERGAGEGEGYTLNLPLPLGTAWPAYEAALGEALAAVRRFAPDALVVSLGVDTAEGDPLGGFVLQGDDFPRLGERVARARCPTLFVLEGGYGLERLGAHVVRTLMGFLQG
jgi:acetoin utilization deacetylase AcuC-like enzyme